MEETKNINESEDLEFEDVVKAELNRVYQQGLASGVQTVCTVISQHIESIRKKPGKISFRDYERMTDYIYKFCLSGLKSKASETESVQDQII